MRIGFDARAIRYRGIGTYSRNLLLHFANSGIEFVVFCQDEEKEAIPSADSFTLVSANMDPLARHSRSAFRSLVEQSGVDLVHIPSPWAPTPSPVPLVATIHDVTPLLYPRSLGPTLRMRYKRQLADTVADARRIITVSRISQSALSAYCGVDPAKVSVIHNGVSEQFFPQADESILSAVRHRYSLPDKFVFWVGDFRPEKNLPFLVQAWARLLRRLPDIPPLVLAGSQTGQFRIVRDEVGPQGCVGLGALSRDSSVTTILPRCTRRRPFSSFLRSTKDSGFRHWRRWRVAPPASYRTPRLFLR